MSDEKEPTQETPKGARIPIPRRKDFDRLLGKVAKPPKKRASKDSTGRPPEE